MSRCAFTLTIKSGMEEEYDKRHQEVWEELINLLKESGFKNYTIFRSGFSLFAYMEHDGDIQEALSGLNANPIQRKWYHYMSDVLVREENKKYSFLKEVFHLD